MKSKIIYLLIFSLLVWACEKDIVLESLNSEKLHRVTQDNLISYLHACKGMGADTKSLNNIDIKPVLHDGDTVMYIVNYDDGWDVLSADKRAPVILMSCDSGYLEEQELYQNEYQSDYVNTMKGAIYDLKKSDESYPISEEDNWNDIALLTESEDTWTDWYLTGSTTMIDTLAYQDHLLTTHWGQEGKWNNKVPFTNSLKTTHCYTGCVMVAGSQLLHYLHYKLGVPNYIYTSSNSVAFIPDGVQFITLNDNNITFGTNSNSCWDLMPLTQSDNVPQGRFDYVSTLMARIGYLTSAEYYRDGTGAFTLDLLSAFESEFSIKGYSKYQADFNIVRKQIIEYKLPCIFSIMKSSSYGGHSVVVDGYKDIGIFTRMFYQKHNNLAQVIKKEERILEDRHQFVAINWGWDGTGDYDSGTGATIWYNTSTIDWRGYDTFKYMLYGFEVINE